MELPGWLKLMMVIAFAAIMLGVSWAAKEISDWRWWAPGLGILACLAVAGLTDWLGKRRRQRM